MKTIRTMMILDMKQRVLLTIILLMVFCSYSFAGTPKAYCVYVENTKTVTIYYDDQMDSRPGTEKCVIVNMGNMSNGPSSLKNKDKVENAVINPSFKDSGYTSTTGWFAYMTNLKTIDGLQNIDFSKIRFAASMFGQCESLESIDLSSYEMPALEHAESMFMNCFKLKSVKLFKTSSNLRFVQNMFNHCNSLTSIDLTPLVTSGVESMSSMFEWCINLTSLDLSKFDTSSMTSMMGAFSYCYSLEHLDLSSFNTSKVTMMQNLFESSNLLNTIYVGNGWSTEKVTNSDKMFSGCEKLIGGAGTKYDPNHIDGTYAHIDSRVNPGYFSAKSAGLWVGGTKVTSANCAWLPVESGSASYDFGTKTLTLNNATISVTAQGDYCIANGLSAEQREIGIDGLTIQVNGDCILNASNIAMMINGNTTLTGTGKLSVDGITAVWIEEGKDLTVGLDHFYATASEEVIDGFYGGLSIDGTKIKSFVCEPKSTGWHYNTINGLFMDLIKCHFADPEGPWQYGEVERFNNWDGIYLRYGLGQYRGKVVIEPDSEPLRYRLWVGGTRVTSKNKNAIGVASGTASYDPATHTLTLNNANIVAGGYDDGISNGLANIEGMADFKIVCKGENNSIDAMESGGSGMALYGNTTITGSRLGISAYDTNNKGIFAGKDVILTLKDADVYIEAASPVYSQNGVVYVNHSRLEALPTSSNERVSAVSDAKAFNMTNCAFADQGDGTDPAYLYYDSDEQMREICLSGAPYHGRIVIVPTGYAISTDINAIDNGELTIDSSLSLYNLQGQRVSHPVKGQIYIQNGRKVKF